MRFLGNQDICKEGGGVDERKLIQRAKQGDTYAFEQLIHEHRVGAFNLAFRMLGNRDDADDAAQDAMVKVFKSIGSFREQSKFSTWVYRLTYNVCIDIMRKQKPGTTTELDERLVDKSPTPEEELEHNERQKQIKAAIAALTPDYRSAIVLRDVNGHSYDEIAQILGCSVGTVKSRINRGRLKLKEILSE